MKTKLFFGLLCAALALVGCSSEEFNDGGNHGELSESNFSNNYLNVSIAMPTSNGTRANDEDDPNFQIGTENESKVNNIVFFFFDDKDICVDIQKMNNPTFTPLPSIDPNIENVGTIEVRLRSGLTYSKLAVALNTTAQDVNTLKVDIKNFSDLEARSKNYASFITKTGKDKGVGQTMSNSVYFDESNETEQPLANHKVCLAPITDENIYNSEERPYIDDLIAGKIPNKKKEYVEIYVERTAARIDVSEATFDMKNYYISTENDGTKRTTITLYDYETSTTKEITVKPVVKGMCLNVLTTSANLLKPINPKEVGYGEGKGSYKKFQWNDPKNKRCYWASTEFEKANLKYFSWNDATEQGPAAFTQYINPNTQDFEPEASNEKNSANTKIMVVAELYQYEDGKPHEKPLDLVRYGADYMLPSSLLAHTANLVNIAVRTINWEAADLTLNGVALTDAQVKNIKTAVNNAFAKGLTGASFQLNMRNPNNPDEPGETDWEAAVAKAEGFTYTIDNIEQNLIAVAKSKVDETIQQTLETINQPMIFYWKDGKTYFYTCIRHQGFYGLTGNGNDDFLYGVVRNHIYDVKLEGIYGLGTPVIDPGKPIDPDRSDSDRPSFIKTKINILKWRIVNNNVTLH